MKRVVIPSGRDAMFLHGVPEAATAILAADFIYKAKPKIVILLTESIPKSEEWAEDIAAFLDSTKQDSRIRLHLFDQPPSTEHPDAFDRICDRLAVLSALGERSNTERASSENSALLLAATPESILAPCPSVESHAKNERVVKQGEKLSFQNFAEELAERFDYSSEILCETPAQFAVRGGLIDVYPVNGEFPVRIDFFGDEIEDLRRFDPSTQRTIESVDSVTLASAGSTEDREVEGAFFGHLKCPVTWILREPEDLLAEFPLVFHYSEKRKSAPKCFIDALDRKAAKKDKFLGMAEIDAGRGIFDNASCHEEKVETLESLRHDNSLDELGLERFESERSGRKAYLRGLLLRAREGFSVQIAAGVDSEKRRITETIEEEEELRDLQVTFLQMGLREGFALVLPPGEKFLGRKTSSREKGLLVATAREILGRERSRRPGRSKRMVAQRPQVDQALDFSELVEGDFLVHLQHGVCQYRCIQRIEDEGRQEEAVTVEFADGILLHVPLPESHLLSRYVGLVKSRPKLAKLGGKSWFKAKEAAEQAALDMAADLLRMQAAREAAEGHAFQSDEDWQKEFEDAFAFTETPDQLSAIEAVKQDMESRAPMDRLLCGDVGYGKTEVALRGAFKAVMDGRQVAVLAPTTVLCQQHLNVFRERVADFPVTVETLSRLRGPKEQKRILAGLVSGGIDILVGTHRILSADVRFRDLGLLIVDEEQRFGVRHKESIKKMKTSVDVLTLSATPIPRTLYFAMVGARALSSIETAPVNRRPIRTEVMRHTPEVVKKAVEAEIRRDGQVFYLHNKVKTIQAVASRLKERFPKLRIVVGHGQMGENELEEVMTQFVAHKYDMLVCTTIIEAGIDIPNCNTIIIEGADRFGLSQLYQLRGRVGRFDKQAYAYLLLNSHKPVSDKARKRLSAIRQITRLGAGFRIALRDLELRGAGNLLGGEQSGHVAGVGFDLYCRLLKQSVARLKGDEKAIRSRANIRLDFTTSGVISETDSQEPETQEDISDVVGSYLPEQFAAETRLRIDFYRKLANAIDAKEVESIRDELSDRFGELPKEAKTLLLETEIRCLAEEAGFDRLETEGTSLQCRFAKGKKPNKSNKLLKVAGRLPRLSEKEPFLKLKEIVRFLKLRIYAKEVE